MILTAELTYWEIKMSQCYFEHHKSRLDATWIDLNYTNSKQQTKKNIEKIKIKTWIQTNSINNIIIVKDKFVNRCNGFPLEYTACAFLFKSVY